MILLINIFFPLSMIIISAFLVVKYSKINDIFYEDNLASYDTILKDNLNKREENLKGMAYYLIFIAFIIISSILLDAFNVESLFRASVNSETPYIKAITVFFLMIYGVFIAGALVYYREFLYYSKNRYLIIRPEKIIYALTMLNNTLIFFIWFLFVIFSFNIWFFIL